MGEKDSRLQIDEARVKRMMDRIIKLEKSNIQTKHYSDRDMVAKIKSIIREEADAYVD
ncbi:hypothetical protein [Senegalimassilia faecalis]|uniref:hypothetical protein n=1 Tax=Senegalimassilia faecalis TaxID=2509433 RepID=UPI00137640AA|nr:hypothetical protein [Senegalimassilia faecalis]